MRKQTLAIISAVVGGAVGGTIATVICNKKNTHAIDDIKKMSDKHLAMFLLMNQWIKTKQEKKNIASYFIDRQYKNIAIYGMSYIGERLYEELKNFDINVRYAIDQKADFIYADIDVVSPESILEPVDAVVVTSTYFMNDIKETLSARVSCPIISLEDILYDI